MQGKFGLMHSIKVYFYDFFKVLLKALMHSTKVYFDFFIPTWFNLVQKILFLPIFKQKEVAM